MSEPKPSFIHPIRINWGDCDSAKIAYTGRFTHWALEALEAWYQSKTGETWYTRHIDRAIDTPFVHLSIDFVSPVTPRHMLDCEVILLKLGNTSMRHQVIGRQDGVECFRGIFVSVFTDIETMRAEPPPEDIVKAILAE
ncbi:MAG: acyl-CoA thioesterase [Rhodobacteraceae bacterium]|nr:acyl-CoA thioesterase [Paracoccaceae bacterium]